MSYFKHILQDVQADASNSSNTNITSGGYFVGVAATTLGVAGIQVSLRTDQNCTVWVDQAPTDVLVDNPTGTSAATNNTTTLTGTGTYFTKNMAIGDTIVFDPTGTNQTRTVASVTSDTVLDVTDAFTGGALNAKAFQLYPWDIKDSYEYHANDSFGITVQAVNSYVRVRVYNTGFATTKYFRLQTALCPIVEAVPRSLDSGGNLKVGVKSIEDEYGFEVENTPVGEMRVVIPTRLVGANFEGSTIDTAFWISGVANSGTVVQSNAEVTLSTAVTAPNGMARFYTYRRARYVSGNSMCYRSVIQLSAAAVNNKRRWGIAYASTMPTTGTTDLMTDGAWFQFDGTTFGVALRRAGTANETLKVSGEFNGTLGLTYTPGTTVKTYEIYWTNSKVYFVIGGEILHTFSADATTWCSTMNFYIYMDNVNSNNLQTNHTLEVRVASIRRLGALLSQPTSYYFAVGVTAGVNLKLGAGNLHSAIFSNIIGGAVITLSDSTSAATPVIFTFTASQSSDSLVIDFKGIPFFFGLRLTVATKNCSAVIIYE